LTFCTFCSLYVYRCNIRNITELTNLTVQIVWEHYLHDRIVWYWHKGLSVNIGHQDLTYRLNSLQFYKYIYLLVL